MTLVLSAMLMILTTNAQDTTWIKNNTWYFDNFQDPLLPWSLFRETFIGVAPEPSGDFDQLFYNYLYKDKLAQKGHCFGISTMANLLRKNGGYLGYCYPPYVYSGENINSGDTVGPTDPNLKTAIAIVHGNQINHGFLSFLLDVIAIGKNRDGRYAYDQVNYYLAKDDPPVISITKDLNPAGGGHVLLPYRTSVEAGVKKIWVYDCNHSFYKPDSDGHGYYVDRKNYIEVSSSGAWKFNKSSSTTSPDYWSGDPGSGGNCIVIPLSVAGKKDRLPQSLIAEGAYALNTIFILGDVEVTQLTNPFTDRHYFGDDGIHPENDPDKNLNNVMPFIPLEGEQEKTSEGHTAVYFFKGEDPLVIRYRAWGDFKIVIIYNGHYFEKNGIGDGQLQEFSPLDARIL
jgi:hypothetical protein